MATEGPGRVGAPSLTSLPRYEDIPQIGDGLDAARVRDAFDAFRRHAAQLQAQLRVLQAAGARTGPSVEPTGHAVRMDALHLIRAAAEFADTIERDAQNAAGSQLSKTEEEVSRRQHELQDREAEIERYRQESERQRAEMLNATRNETRELLAKAHADATRELQEAEAKGSRLLEQSRHQATELTNAARAEVEQTLEWARAQASAVLARAQHGAEQLLSAAGLGQDAIGQVAGAIMRAAESAGEASRPQPPAAAFAGPAAVTAPEAQSEPPVSGPPVSGPPVSGPPVSGLPLPPPLSSPAPPPVSGGSSAQSSEEDAAVNEEPSEPQP
jgi:cell division septum initiation protein DivIVA